MTHFIQYWEIMDNIFLGSFCAVSGTRKTFTLNVLIERLKVKEEKFVASYTGIEDTLLIGRSIFHSHTNAPQDPPTDIILGIERHAENCIKIMASDVLSLTSKF